MYVFFFVTRVLSNLLGHTKVMTNEMCRHVQIDVNGRLLRTVKPLTERLNHRTNTGVIVPGGERLKKRRLDTCTTNKECDLLPEYMLKRVSFHSDFYFIPRSISSVSCISLLKKYFNNQVSLSDMCISSRFAMASGYAGQALYRCDCGQTYTNEDSLRRHRVNDD
jgi:hypothetical protein